MATTYELISSSTVGATSVASFSFSSIPSTYTDLIVKTSIRSTRAASDDSVYIYFNTDTTAANYRVKGFYVASSVIYSFNTSSYAAETEMINGDGSTLSTFGNAEFYIPNYTSSNAKSILYDAVGENNASNASMGLSVSSWSGTAAINRITIVSANGANLMQYSSFYLYGISKS
jgi:hypothetical protein